MGDLVFQITLMMSLLIIVGLLFTHFYAGHKVRGLLVAALGLISSTIGYLISTLLPPILPLIFVANVLFLVGMLLFYSSAQQAMGRNIHYIENSIIFIVFVVLLTIFTFAYEAILLRQATISVALITIAIRQVYLLTRHSRKRFDIYLFSYLVLGVILVLLQIIRLFLIAFGINNNTIPQTGITANIMILIITAVVFDLLALVLVITTSIVTRIELFQERKLLEEWSTTDYLTRLPNRRKLYQYLETLIDSHTPFAVAITDIDGFKMINDIYGHPVGDAVLLEYGRRIEAHIQPATFVARFGGDEFVYVILLDEGKAAVAYNILTKVTLENLIVYNKHFTFDLASSGGVALFPEDGHTISELLTHADHALYMMKNNKRQQIGFYQDVRNRPE